VPETTVNKNSHPASGKDEIRVAEYALMTPPSFNFVYTKQSDESKLRIPIVSGPDF